MAGIDSHRASRPKGWNVVEEPYALALALRRADAAGHVLIVDCLTLWVTQMLEDPSRLHREIEDLLTTLPTLRSPVWLIGNETGLGIMPLGQLTRDFIDITGRLHQNLAQQCDRVIFMLAGLAQPIKGNL